jgi:hypothetical protein
MENFLASFVAIVLLIVLGLAIVVFAHMFRRESVVASCETVGAFVAKERTFRCDETTAGK